MSLFRLGPLDSPRWSRETCRCEHTSIAHIGGEGKCLVVTPKPCPCEGFELARSQAGSGEPPQGGETVSEGPEQGEVCAGNVPPYGEAAIGHRPAVRRAAWRCLEERIAAVSIFTAGRRHSALWLRETCRCEHTRAAHVMRGGAADVMTADSLECCMTDCQCEQFELARRQAGNGEPPQGGETVSEGPEQGEVCVGSSQYKVASPGGHRPVVRVGDGRCFLCEPMTSLEKLTEIAESAVKRQAAWPDCCAGDCDCEAVLMEPVPDGTRQQDPAAFVPPHSANPLTAYSVTYAVEGGQQYTIGVPGDASVMAVDGILKVWQPGRPVHGIVAVRTYPELTTGEENHEPEAEDHHG